MASFANRATKKRRNAKLRAAGLCIVCAIRPITKWKNYCDGCHEKVVAARRSCAARKSAAGLCSCGRPALVGFKKCEPCLDYSRVYQLERCWTKKGYI